MATIKLALLLITVVQSSTATSTQQSENNSTCHQLQHHFPVQVIFPGSLSYLVSNSFWDTGCSLRPSCIFQPTSGEDIASALGIIKDREELFAVKSGGHMCVPGFNNVDGGVLISLERMKSMVWEDSGNVLRVGAGLRWGEVYKETLEHGKFVVGGRVPAVGVGGLLFGGGLSFFSAEKGLGCDNVVGYEVITADSSIISVTAASHPDLFRALRGGSSNFGIVASFSLKTYSIGETWGAGFVGDYHYSPGTRGEILDAIAVFHTKGSLDQYAGAVIDIVLIPGNDISVYRGVLFYSKPVPQGEIPAAFKALLEIEGEEHTFMGRQSLSDVVETVGDGVVEGLTRNTFHAATLLATRSSIHATASFWETEISKIKDISGLTATLTFQPVPASLILAGKNNVLGLDANRAPYTWIIHTVSWSHDSDAARVFATQKKIGDLYNAWAKERGLWDRYVYMNDADERQAEDVFRGYGGENLRFLEMMREEWDPERVFSRLLKGGYKF